MYRMNAMVMEEACRAEPLCPNPGHPAHKTTEKPCKAQSASMSTFCWHDTSLRLADTLTWPCSWTQETFEGTL